MAHFDETLADCLVYSFKEGILSAIAHDLMIRVTRFSVDVDEVTHAVKARFDARSLRVVDAMRDGVEAPALLSDRDKTEIGKNIAVDVLDASRYPDVLFASRAVTPEGRGFRIEGTLTLHGRSHEIEARSHDVGDRQVAELVLHQPDFGIKPYSALLGTLKIKPDVRVRISLPWKK
jgi:polyisoprenoid-binding protein YceI